MILHYKMSELNDLDYTKPSHRMNISSCNATETNPLNFAASISLGVSPNKYPTEKSFIRFIAILAITFLQLLSSPYPPAIGKKSINFEYFNFKSAQVRALPVTILKIQLLDASSKNSRTPSKTIGGLFRKFISRYFAKYSKNVEIFSPSLFHSLLIAYE